MEEAQETTSITGQNVTTVTKNSEEYLDRHLIDSHNDLDTFSYIRDCMDSESRDSTSSQMGYPECYSSSIKARIITIQS